MSVSTLCFIHRLVIITVMLNEAKISRPRPSFEVKAEAEANFLTARPGRGQR